MTLFQLHDQEGVPLGISAMAAKAQGVQINLPKFYLDAISAGWKPAKARSVVGEAMRDAGESPADIEARLVYLDNGPSLGADGWAE